MKKLLLAFSMAFVLAACSANDEATTTYKADPSHLQNIVFEGVDAPSDRLIFEDGTLTIIDDDVLSTITPETAGGKINNRANDYDCEHYNE